MDKTAEERAIQANREIGRIVAQAAKNINPILEKHFKEHAAEARREGRKKVLALIDKYAHPQDGGLYRKPLIKAIEQLGESDE